MTTRPEQWVAGDNDDLTCKDVIGAGNFGEVYKVEISNLQANL
jgi:hypothetical protein